jgi:hypothetical protein
METAEVLSELLTRPNGCDAQRPFYWFGIAGALVAGFVAAWPVNYVVARRRVTHAHTKWRRPNHRVKLPGRGRRLRRPADSQAATGMGLPREPRPCSLLGIVRPTAL